MTLPVKYTPPMIEGSYIEVEELPLTLPEYAALKQGFVEGRATDARNLLICQMLFGTGLRIAELLRITPQMVNSSGLETTIMIRRGKKKSGEQQYEYVPLHPELSVDISSFIRGNQIKLTDRVFKVTDRQVRRVFNEAGIRSLGRPVHPHQLRSLYISFNVDNGVPMAVVSKMVGHADPKTTTKHYLKVSMERRWEINRRIPI